MQKEISMRRDLPTLFKKALAKSGPIVIITHWSPDGDAMGSSLGLYHYLKAKGKDVKVIIPNEYPEFLDFLPGKNTVINHLAQKKKAEDAVKKAGTVFTLDFNSFGRIEELGKAVQESKAVKIMIDHHQAPDDYAQLYYHDVNASSTCELIYEFIVALGDKKLVDKKIATCLYTGLLTDTGSFRFPSTSATTHRIVADLIEKGANNADIYNAIHDDNTVERLKLLGYCISDKLNVLNEYHVAYISLSEEEQNRFQYKKGDTEGVVNYPLSIRGLKFSVFFSERDGIVKISFRSKGKFDVNKFARTHFSGGGHKNAAGGKSTVSLDQTIKNFLAVLPLYKKELA
ncbi:MAG: exopolyphosphatase [Bacteroidetes bacterium]|nr:exopolyphosphatase [Bacteroidota bacterium]